MYSRVETGMETATETAMGAVVAAANRLKISVV
jgi:hypothetical protein